MSKISKWLMGFGIVVAVISIALFIFIKVKVGAVNTPIGDSNFESTMVGQRIKVPDGFSIGIYANDVEGARVIRFSRQGDLLVALPSLDKVIILKRDANGDSKADGQRVLIENLNGPNGLDFYKEWLYIAETDAIGRIRFNHETGDVEGEYERIVTGLSGGENHWKKTLRFGEDGFMYVTMGSSCNVCEEVDERRATMVRYTAEGKDETIYARGLRNSAGFDWSPRDGLIYATDNGRDLLGDDFPPCELNQVVEGAHYGWPYANGDKIPDPDFGAGHADLINRSLAPVFNFQPHNAPLGMAFVRSKQFPESYRQAAIVALHGSWNRSEKDGYKVVSLHWDEQGNISSKDFVTGFLQDDAVVGRPTEITEGLDGAIYIADDYANVIYRVAYGEAQTLDLGVAAKKFNAKMTLSVLSESEVETLSTAGQTLFTANNCIACHADDGSGLKILENLGERYELDSLANFIRRPNSPMPIYPFSDEQRRALSVYLIERYPGK